MALKATVFKAELTISDMDRHYYQTHPLTLAQHPSETDERLMVRVLLFALYASERLNFTKGLSSEDEPDIWQKSLSDEIELWIDLGEPSDKRIRQACGRAQSVIICTYQPRSALVWYAQQKALLQRFDNLRIRHLSQTTVTELGALAARSMNLQCMIQDDDCWLSNEQQSVKIEWLDFEK